MAICTNCATDLVGEYCHVCGQKRFVESDRHFSHLVHQFLASATDLDGRIWRTVRALLSQPGLLSRDFMLGRRARWISPVSLFLAVSVVYFLAPLHGGDVVLQFNQQVDARIRALANGPDESLTPTQRASSGQAHTRWTAHLVDERVRARDEAERAASGGTIGYGYRDYRLAYDAKADDVAKALIILHVPFTALALALLFVRKHRYFAEHFVVALHFFAFTLIALQIVIQSWALAKHLVPAAWLPPEWTLDWLMRIILPLYAVLALRRAYAVGWIGAVAAAAGMLAAVVTVNLFIYRAVLFLVTFALT